MRSPHYGFLPDDQVPQCVDWSETSEPVEDLSVDPYRDLREEAVSAQKLGVSRNARLYVKGAMDRVSIPYNRKVTSEKMFSVSQLVEWTEGYPDALMSMLRAGRTRTRLSAAMGVGKTTKLASIVARDMDHRVLLVGVDATSLGLTAAYVKSAGIGSFKRNWRTRREEWVCVASYRDFCAFSASERRGELYSSFETIIFDEASMAAPEVEAAMRIFAVVGGAETNLVMCSATIRTDVDGVSSGALGNVRRLSKEITPEEAIASEKLVTEYLVDRTVVFLPNDERLVDMENHYIEHGVETRVLHDSSRQEELEAVCEWLSGSSSTPRVLIAHCCYSITYNFPVAFVIVFPYVTRGFLEGDSYVLKEVPMTDDEVSQAVSRAGRGIVDGSGGLVMSPERRPAVYSEDEKVDIFLQLTRASIAPLRKGTLSSVYSVFPDGLSADTANLLLKVNLPPVIAARYLAADGQFAGRYATALTFFSQPDHYIMGSDCNEPAAYDGWQEEPLFGAEESGIRVKVPLRASGELKVIMHAIEAIASGRINVQRWRMPNKMFFRDGRDSDDEGPSTREIAKRKLVRVRSFEKPRPLSVRVSTEGWSYTAISVNRDLGGAGTRRAVALPNERLVSALRDMELSIEDYKPPGMEVSVREVAGGTVGAFEVESGVVESPGGTVVCELPMRICSALNLGRSLSYEDFKPLIDAFRVHGIRFVASRLFDCFANPWDSILNALVDEKVVSDLVSGGLSPSTYSMLAAMNSRFGVEVFNVFRGSNVFKRRYLRVFVRSPSVDEIMREVRSGKFAGIAQSEKFLERVITIKTKIDDALIFAESQNQYLPMHITAAQRVLPLHANTSVGHVGNGRMLEPGGYASGYYSPRKGMEEAIRSYGSSYGHG